MVWRAGARAFSIVLPYAAEKTFSQKQDSLYSKTNWLSREKIFGAYDSARISPFEVRKRCAQSIAQHFRAPSYCIWRERGKMFHTICGVFFQSKQFCAVAGRRFAQPREFSSGFAALPPRPSGKRRLRNAKQRKGCLSRARRRREYNLPAGNLVPVRSVVVSARGL